MAENPDCMCGKRSVMKVCHKVGPNENRPFFTCETRTCNFFESADGEPWVREEIAFFPKNRFPPSRFLLFFIFVTSFQSKKLFRGFLLPAILA